MPTLKSFPMADQIPSLPPENATPPPVPYKDRSTGLKVFGILTILLGCMAAMFVPLMFISSVMAARTTGSPTPVSAVLPAAFVYGLTAVVLIWLGIGSVMARRWARALLLIVSWSWLILGLISVVCVGLFMPKIISKGVNGQPMPPAAIGVMIAVMAVILGIFFIIIPGIWAFFYRSPHVKATCEARDPVARWTDACPLPVLASALWMAFSAVCLLCMPLTGHAVIPCFGIFLAGVWGTIASLFLATVWGYSAWLLYKLKNKGWWLILGTLCAFFLSSIVTYSTHDVVEMYRAAGYPETQIEQIKSTGIFSGNGMSWITGIASIPWVGYLLYIKKYFRRQI